MGGRCTSLLVQTCQDRFLYLRKSKCLQVISPLLKSITWGREGNVAAHKLARHAQYVDYMVVRWHSTPDLIKQYVNFDAMLDLL